MHKKNLFFIIFIIIFTSYIYILINQTTSQKSLFFILIISLLFVLFTLIVYVPFLSTSFFFIVFYIMLFYVQPLIFYFTDLEYNYSFIEVRTLITLIVIGMHLFLLGWSLVVTHNKQTISFNVDFELIKKAVRWLMFLSLSAIILLFIDAKTLDILSLSRMELKNSGSLIRLFSTFLLYTTSILFFLVFFTKDKRKNINIFFWIIFILVFEIVVFSFFRTRSLMVAHFSAALVGYYYSNLYLSGSQRKLKYIKKVTIYLFGTLLGILAIVSRFLRGFLEPGASLDNFSIDWKIFLQKSVEAGDLGYSEVVLKIINLVPNTYPFFDGQSYYRIFFIMIPRSIWENKPINTESIVASWLYPELPGMSLPPGIIGDLYINFGISGIIFMLFFGILFSFFDRKTSITNFMFWSVSATWVFHLVRGGFTNPILIMAFLALNIIIIKKFIFNQVIVTNQKEPLK